MLRRIFIRFIPIRKHPTNQVCFDGYLSVVFELWIFIHYRMLIEFKLMTGIVIQQLCIKEFTRFLKFPFSRQKTKCASTDIYPLFLSSGYSSTIGCSSSFKLMTRIVVQQLWTKEFTRFLKFPCFPQKKPSVLRRIFIRCF